MNPQTILNVPRGNPTQAVNELNRLHEQITGINDEILEITRSKRPNEIYDLINSLITDLNLFDRTYSDDNSLIIQLKDFPEKHTDAYSDKKADQIFKLSDLSEKINQSLNDLKQKSNFVISEFDKTHKASPKNYAELRIGTDKDVPMISDFTLILESIQDLYDFICFIYKIDEKKNHIILNHIATGSWFTEILGIKQVVITIENLLKEFGSFLRDLINGTINRERFENECKKAETFINLMKLAKENGIDNAELGIFKSLKPLVDSFSTETTTIFINEKEILELKELEKLTLIERKKKRTELLENINLLLEEGEKNKNDTKH
ncbi:hypothetical protein [Reichenbachiella ulvae]|uniref:Uncharacterized protein n=1 Tax=Reichenbachiella ulvae TaxID=2980104 RepID=A0ABT3CNR8_9BACT|nr:hypothetical protein [Reichenbachiella ulvae]MCV9385287.1 hypothetical protein [Reichenbachiella ulvae]